jgi:hypothetical protein
VRVFSDDNQFDRSESESEYTTKVDVVATCCGFFTITVMKFRFHNNRKFCKRLFDDSDQPGYRSICVRFYL